MSDAHLELGTTLSNRYVIEGILGQGGMGAVYLARLQPLGKLVAVKRLSTEEAEPAALEQFIKEAKFLAHLEHPGLTPVTDFFEDQGQHYFVMGHIRGQTLAELADGTLTADTAIDWGLEICDVLEFLHSQEPPVLFRDLKPSNVMLDDDGRIRLVDFGIAQTLEDGGGTSTFLQGVGTGGFAPLEQYDGPAHTDVRSDIYSLGATLFNLMTSVPPRSAVERVSSGEPALQHELTPRALHKVVARMMAIDKKKRYQSVAEVKRALQALRSDSGILGALSGSTATPATRRGQQVALVALLVFLTLPFSFQPGHYGLVNHIARPIHEFVHVVVGLFGTLASAWGGALSTCLFFLIVTIYLALRKRAKFSAWVAASLGFHSLAGLGVAVADAHPQQLELCSTDGGDWNIILRSLQALHHHDWLGEGLIVVGKLGMTVGLVATVACLYNQPKPRGHSE